SALFVLWLVIGTLSGCRATGGEIPGIEPPSTARTTAAAPATPSPTVTSSPSVHPATPKSGQGQTRSQPNTSLARNSIYAVDLGGVRVSCKIKVRSPKPPLRDANLAAYGRKLVKCLVKAV